MKRHSDVKHFDIPLNLDYVDRMPYKVNKALCTREHIKIHSGNIIKNYNVTIDEEKHIIEPMDYDPNIIESTSQEIPHYEEPDEVNKDSSGQYDTESETTEDNSYSEDNIDNAN